MSKSCDLRNYDFIIMFFLITNTPIENIHNKSVVITFINDSLNVKNNFELFIESIVIYMLRIIKMILTDQS